MRYKFDISLILLIIKLLEIKIDSRLNFESHVSDLSKSVAKQLNALL